MRGAEPPLLATRGRGRRTSIANEMLKLASNSCLKHVQHMALAKSNETGDKLLIAAEMLFAERGYDGVSLRDITAEANVNVAAVNYHYSDKQTLYLEVLVRRLRELSRARLTRLERTETQLAGAPVSLTETVDILAAPLLQPDCSEMPSFGAASRRLVGRALVEPLDFLPLVIATELQPTLARCGQAIRRHFPVVPPADFIWRYSFLVGALHHAAATLHDMKNRTQGLCVNDDGANALRNFRVFATAVFAADGFG